MVLDYSDIDTIVERATSELFTKKEFDERMDQLMNLIDTAHEHLLVHRWRNGDTDHLKLSVSQ